MMNAKSRLTAPLQEDLSLGGLMRIGLNVSCFPGHLPGLVAGKLAPYL